jgi:hypothetical protein
MNMNFPFPNQVLGISTDVDTLQFSQTHMNNRQHLKYA